MRPGISLGVPGYPGVSWGNQTDPCQGGKYYTTDFYNGMRFYFQFDLISVFLSLFELVKKVFH